METGVWEGNLWLQWWYLCILLWRRETTDVENP